jgi:hypothetical protein
LKVVDREPAKGREVFWLLVQVLNDWIFDDERFTCIKEIVIHVDACQPIFSICQLFALGVEVGFHHSGHLAWTGAIPHAKGDFIGHLNSEVMKRRQISLINPAVSKKGHEMAPQRLINLSRFRQTFRHLQKNPESRKNNQ